MLQQQEMERKMREYNDYHNQQIQNKHSLISPESISLIGSGKSSSPTQDKNIPANSKNIARNKGLSQKSGSSRLELTSREVRKYNICQPKLKKLNTHQDNVAV